MPKSADVAGFLAMSSFWGLNYVMVKFALVYEPPLMFLLFRVLFAAIFSLFLIKGGLKFPRDLMTNVKLVILSALNITLFMGLWFIGESTESASISSILVYTYPGYLGVIILDPCINAKSKALFSLIRGLLSRHSS